MLGRARDIHDMDDSRAKGNHDVGDDAPMTAPPDRLGAHDRRPEPPRDHQKCLETPGEFLAGDIVGVSSEGRMSPPGIYAVCGRPAPAAELGKREVIHAGARKRSLQVATVVLRLAAGSGEPPDVRDHLDLVGREEREEIRERVGGMSHRPELERRGPGGCSSRDVTSPCQECKLRERRFREEEQ